MVQTVHSAQCRMTIIKPKPKHVIVLVGGTVDPVNTEEFKYSGSLLRRKKGGDSKKHKEYIARRDKMMDDLMEQIKRDDPEKYNALQNLGTTEKEKKLSDSLFYWEENRDFQDQLFELESTYGVELFDGMMWSGDNSVSERKSAGMSLIQQLCEEYDIKKGWKNKPIHFHFIGHSHGGNVINEATHAVVSNGNWPKPWEIKTIMYQSTPFFQRQHQVKTTYFHDNFQAITITNRFDLTARMIADFSMHLWPIFRVVSIPKLMEAIDEKKEDFSKIDFSVFERIKNRLGKSGLIWAAISKKNLERAEAQGAYQALVDTTDFFVKTFKFFEHHVGDMRQTNSNQPVMSQSVIQQLKNIFKSCRETAENAKRSFADHLENINNNSELVTTTNDLQGHLTSLFPFIQRVNQAINIRTIPSNGIIPTPPTTNNEILDAILQILIDQIDVVDDTKMTPHHMYQSYKHKLTEINVAEVDKYYPDYQSNNNRKGQYDTWIKDLETLEGRLPRQVTASGQNKQLLTDLLFTLAGQDPRVQGAITQAKRFERKLWWLEFLFTDRLDQASKELRATLSSYIHALEQRNYSAIPSKLSDKKYRGDIPYFAVVSHSVSRQSFYPGRFRTFEILKDQISHP